MGSRQASAKTAGSSTGATDRSEHRTAPKRCCWRSISTTLMRSTTPQTYPYLILICRTVRAELKQRSEAGAITIRMTTPTSHTSTAIWRSGLCDAPGYEAASPRLLTIVRKHAPRVFTEMLRSADLIAI
jgi:hypothetical protein